MSYTNYLENKILGHVFGGVAYTAPTKYVGLFTAAPGEAGGGTEVVGNGYARQTSTYSVTGNVASNSATIEFPTATGAGWGTLTYLAIFDAVSGGNMLAYAQLTFPREILAGDVFRIPTGNLTITQD
jgi:hypothetical protein